MTNFFRAHIHRLHLRAEAPWPSDLAKAKKEILDWRASQRLRLVK